MLHATVVEDAVLESQDFHHYTPTAQRLSRSDVHFPLTTPRKRAPSITSIADVSCLDSQTIGRFTIHADGSSPVLDDSAAAGDDYVMEDSSNTTTGIWLSVHDLPTEVQNKILDFIMGEVNSVNATNTSLKGNSISHSMRHPRRKAVSELALVSRPWRELVQGRIYRHIKIKGTRAGLAESEEYFGQHLHLTKHIRHIEFWVPVWGDKAATINSERMMQRINQLGIAYGDENQMTAHDLLGFNFKLSVYSATLSEIFSHIGDFFPEARIFTLEGGHCKKSNMIKHFPKMLFASTAQQLDVLPNIRTFVMRGAWNIMRNFDDWGTIEQALPGVEEWHCGYAKPRQEAYTTVNEILLQLPFQLKHVNICLDGMYSKDDNTLGSNSLLSTMHLCEQLGRVAPHLESLTYTGKVCECFWTAAAREATRLTHSKLQTLEIVVKSCCRQRVSCYHEDTGETVTEEIGGIMADGAGITNLVFIKAFERLVMGTVDSLRLMPLLDQIRIRYIDLDSPCALLNPYWHLRGSVINGIWNEEILECLKEVRPGTEYEELGDGLGSESDTVQPKKEDDLFDWRNSSGVNTVNGATTGSSLYPKKKPRSIKTSSYRVIAETRGP